MDDLIIYAQYGAQCFYESPFNSTGHQMALVAHGMCLKIKLWTSTTHRRN